jgi:hypothetical protein
VASRTLRTSYDLNARGYHSYRQEKPAMQPARNVMRVSTRHAAYSCQNAYIRRSMPGFMNPMSQIGTYCELEALLVKGGFGERRNYGLLSWR